MSLSFIILYIGILGYIFKYISNIGIKIIFSPLNLFFLLILCNEYVNKIDKILYIIYLVLYTNIAELFTAISYYPNLSILTVLFISVSILYYISFVDLEFRFKYPKLYKILFLVCFMLIVISITYLRYAAIKVIFDFILKSSGGEPSGGSHFSSNPGGPSESGGSGGSGGNTSSSTHYEKERRRSSSSNSSWSQYSEEVHENDSIEVKSKKFANFIYDSECKRNGVVISREEFDSSESNPLNWNTPNSYLHKRMALEIESRLVNEHNNRVNRFEDKKSASVSNTFTLNDLGIDIKHPLYGSLTSILFPKLPKRGLQNCAIYSTEVGLDKLKALRKV